MRINHNISSLRALNQMHSSSLSLDKTLERLSSGLRINHAADDAAGLAISQKMDTQVRGLGQANRNAMDGISLIQTAEGALNEVHAMLQRIRELAVQVSNDTYDSTDRKSVQSEVEQLLGEIGRISTDTEFNEKKLLNGELERRTFSSNTDIAKMVYMSDGVEAGKYTFDVTSAAVKTQLTSGAATMFDASGKALKGGNLNINGEQVNIEIGDSSIEVLSKVRELANKTNLSIVSSATPYAQGASLEITNNIYGNHPINISGSTELIEGLGLTVATGLTKVDGKDIEIDPASIGGGSGFPLGTTYTTEGQNIIFTSNNNFEFRVKGGKVAGNVVFDVLETGPLNLQIGANEGQFMKIRVPNLSTEALRISDVKIFTSESAQRTISIVDNAINMISSVRSKLGAYQNRLEHTIANLNSASENLTASMSRIQDADMAYEMSQFTQRNIISQAGNAMLAQANQRPQALLQLLQQG